MSHLMETVCSTRNNLASFMEANKSMWSGYFVDANRSQDDYLKQLRQPGTWGDYLEVVHMEILYKVHLKPESE